MANNPTNPNGIFISAIDVSNLGAVMIYWPDVGWVQHPDFIKEGEE